jgi:hypothetical protein
VNTLSAEGGSAKFTELQAEAAEAHVLAGGSLAVTGYAGTGKSYWCRQLVEKLREAGKVVHIIAKTHASCQNFGLGAVTADHWVRKFARRGSCPCSCLVVEEFSQISAYLWNDLAKLAQKMSQFILLGDPGQLEPVKDCWAGCPVQISMNQSNRYHELVGGFSLQMLENKRSDPPLFDFCVGLRAGLDDEKPFEEALEEARKLFKRVDLSNKSPDFMLVVPHRQRMAVNRLQNVVRKPADAVFYKAPPGKRGENSAQDMWVYPGQLLIGAGGAVKKGVFVTVESVGPEGLVLRNGNTLTKAAAMKALRLAHALTVASCQGLTLQGRVRVIPHESMTTRALYVACSRATKAELLEVAPGGPQKPIE